MKKKALLLACAFGVTTAFAQDLTSKKGEPILPEADDWSIGIDASPFLTYFGQFLGSGGNPSPGFNFLNGSTMTIVGKMFVDESTAYRGIVRLGKSSWKWTSMIPDASITTAPTYPTVPSMKEDELKYAATNIGLGAGLEKRRGNTRLQGIYGADAMILLTSTKSSYTYGNALSTTVPVMSGVTTTDFSGNHPTGYSNITTDTYGNTARVTENKPGGMFSVAIRGFIGAEYFILPKISIGGEFGWGIGMSSTGAGSTSVESVDGGSGSVGSQTTETGKSSSFTIDVDRNLTGTTNGTLRLNLHF